MTRKSTLSLEECAEFVRLLQHVVERDGGFMPTEEAWEYSRKFMAGYAPEVLPYRDGDGEFLLHWRDDRWTGWCLCGGWPPPGSTIRNFVTEAVLKDFGEAGLTGITNLSGVIASRSWGNLHPYGFPVSCLHACGVIGDIRETDTVRWFSKVPTDPDWTDACGRRYEGMVKTYGIHESLIEAFFAWRDGGKVASGALLD